MTGLPIANEWRRASCLGCGSIVKRARDAHSIMVGTRDGSWLAVLGVAAGRGYGDSEVPPPGVQVYELGVCHAACWPLALRSLRTQSVSLPEALPAILAEEIDPASPMLNLMAPVAQDTCPFCEEFVKDPSKEDIFPQWLIKELIAAGARVKIGGLWSTKPVGPTTYACRDCNNTWMSTLEQDARPLLERMFFEATLNGEDRLILAKWATMKAFLADASRDRPVIPRGFARDLKTTKLPHEGIQVWAGAFHDTTNFLTALQWDIYAEEGSEDPNLVIATCVTLIVYRVVLQVSIPFYREMRTTPEDFNNSVLAIWPGGKDDVHWPPPYYFDNESVNAVVTRIYDNREPVVSNVTLNSTRIVAPQRSPSA